MTVGETKNHKAMDYYDIISLIVFWVNQEKEDFMALRQITEVVRDKSIDTEEKGDIIFSILRENGLREVELGLVPEDLQEEDISPFQHQSEFKAEMVFLDLMNTRISIIVHLN